METPYGAHHRTVRPVGGCRVIALQPYLDAGVLSDGDVRLATVLIRIAKGPGSSPDQDDHLVALATACALRGLRQGATVVNLTTAHQSFAASEDGQQADPLPWPEPAEWQAACSRHPAVSAPPHPDSPIVMDGNVLWLQRYWSVETELVQQFTTRVEQVASTGAPTAIRAILARLFPDAVSAAAQRLAVASALTGRLTILAGGPGTGKTTTIAGILLALRAVDPTLSVALAAPTGKAAARMQQAITEACTELFASEEPLGAIAAQTLHRLLGVRRDLEQPFRHDRFSPLPYDVVIVDECSMVDVTMMARLLEAVRADARIILVGDPNQLASVEAGAVLGDVVAVQTPLPPQRLEALKQVVPAESSLSVRGCSTVTLTTGHRFSDAIAAVADAITSGDADETLRLLQGVNPEVTLWPLAGGSASGVERVRQFVVAHAELVGAAAHAGKAARALDALDDHRVLCAHRRGPYGVSTWSERIRGWTGSGPDRSGEWPVGQTLLVTANDAVTGLANGDAGVVVATPDGPVMVAFPGVEEPLLIPTVRLDEVTALDAMTVHRGQGSQYASVSIVLPPPTSPLLTRELLYTAVTRARRQVTILGDPESIRAAVTRRIERPSLLTPRLTNALAAVSSPGTR